MQWRVENGADEAIGSGKAALLIGAAPDGAAFQIAGTHVEEPDPADLMVVPVGEDGYDIQLVFSLIEAGATSRAVTVPLPADIPSGNYALVVASGSALVYQAWAPIAIGCG